VRTYHPVVTALLLVAFLAVGNALVVHWLIPKPYTPSPQEDIWTVYMAMVAVEPPASLDHAELHSLLARLSEDTGAVADRVEIEDYRRDALGQFLLKARHVAGGQTYRITIHGVE